jgi:hypothetical protein
VIGGHRDKRKYHVIHTASSLSHASVWLLLPIATIFGWDVSSEDGQQAYLQSANFCREMCFYDEMELSCVVENCCS